jgi:hypothetical protein
VYSFVLANTGTTAETHSLKRYSEELITGKAGKRVPRTPSFEANPLHWVLAALSAEGDWDLDRRNVFRFGRQLLYAKQHHVPVEFLVGFLHQSGSPNEIEKKVKEGATEPWRDRWVAARTPTLLNGS